MTTHKPEPAHTPIRRFRCPDLLWDTYAAVLARQGRERSADLLDHIRDAIATHGTPEELAALQAADAELTERRARKGGRPPRKADES